MYIDTILHHHIRRCPYNIISIMIGLFQCFEVIRHRGYQSLYCNPKLKYIVTTITSLYSLQLNEIHCNKRLDGVMYGLV